MVEGGLGEVFVGWGGKIRLLGRVGLINGLILGLVGS